MTSINLLILGGFLTVIMCLSIAVCVYHSLYNEVSQRKVQASPELISLVEEEMRKALKYHNVKKYEYYRDIFNDLEPFDY